MVIYTEGDITVRVCWANKPYVIAQGDGNPPLKLVGIRLAGDTLQVALLQPPLGVRWVSSDQYLCTAEAESWARKGFQRPRLR